jgi:transposase InsO family protein
LARNQRLGAATAPNAPRALVNNQGPGAKPTAFVGDAAAPEAVNFLDLAKQLNEELLEALNEGPGVATQIEEERVRAPLTLNEGPGDQIDWADATQTLALIKGPGGPNCEVERGIAQPPSTPLRPQAQNQGPGVEGEQAVASDEDFPSPKEQTEGVVEEELLEWRDEAEQFFESTLPPWLENPGTYEMWPELERLPHEQFVPDVLLHARRDTVKRRRENYERRHGELAPEASGVFRQIPETAPARMHTEETQAADVEDEDLLRQAGVDVDDPRFILLRPEQEAEMEIPETFDAGNPIEDAEGLRMWWHHGPETMEDPILEPLMPGAGDPRKDKETVASRTQRQKFKTFYEDDLVQDPTAEQLGFQPVHVTDNKDADEDDVLFQEMENPDSSPTIGIDPLYRQTQSKLDITNDPHTRPDEHGHPPPTVVGRQRMEDPQMRDYHVSNVEILRKNERKTEKLRQAQDTDPFIAAVKAFWKDPAMTENDLPDVCNPLLTKLRRAARIQASQAIMTDNGLLRRRAWNSSGRHARPDEQLFLPLKYRNRVLRMAHGHKTVGGHFGIRKVHARVMNYFWWPGLPSDVIRYVRSCMQCAKMQTVQRTKQSKLQPIAPVSVPFDVLGMDCIGPLDETRKGNKYALVFTDYCTRFVIARALPDIRTQTIIDAFEEMILYTHSVPIKLITDRGSNFCSHAFNEYCTANGIVKFHTTSYSPRCNGLTERTNRSLKTVMRSYIQDQKARTRPDLQTVDEDGRTLYPAMRLLEWDELLKRVQFCINCQESETTGEMPFYLVYGRVPRLSWGLCTEQLLSDEDFAMTQDGATRMREERLRAMRHAWYIATWSVALAQQRQKRHYDTGVKQHRYKPHDVVLLKKNPKKKLGLDDAPFEGPYLITGLTKSKKAARLVHVGTKKDCVVSVDYLRLAPSSLRRE